MKILSKGTISHNKHPFGKEEILFLLMHFLVSLFFVLRLLLVSLFSYIK